MADRLCNTNHHGSHFQLAERFDQKKNSAEREKHRRESQKTEKEEAAQGFFFFISAEEIETRKKKALTMRTPGRFIIRHCFSQLRKQFESKSELPLHNFQLRPPFFPRPYSTGNLSFLLSFVQSIYSYFSAFRSFFSFNKKKTTVLVN